MFKFCLNKILATAVVTLLTLSVSGLFSTCVQAATCNQTDYAGFVVSPVDGKTTYAITKNVMTWEAAKAQAIANGGRLVEIPTQEINDTIVAAFATMFTPAPAPSSSEGKAWIGLYDPTGVRIFSTVAESAVDKQCPSGFSFSSGRNRCEKAVECDNGGTYNPSWGWTGEGACVVYDAEMNETGAPPVCSSGTLDKPNAVCWTNYTPVCQEGATYNSSTQVCETQNNQTTPDRFSWINGVGGSFKNWKPGQPDNNCINAEKALNPDGNCAGENWANINVDGKWSDDGDHNSTPVQLKGLIEWPNTTLDCVVAINPPTPVPTVPLPNDNGEQWCKDQFNLNLAQCAKTDQGTDFCPLDKALCTDLQEVPPKCPTGATLNTTRHMCQKDVTSITCPTGYTWDSSIDKCLKTPSCDSTGTLNGVRGQCEQVLTQNCPVDYSYDETLKTCTKNLICPDGMTYNNLHDRCEGPLTCVAGSTFNVTNGKCEQSVGCPEGTTIKVAAGQACSDPSYTYNTGTSRCEKSPVCAAGTYNATYDKCILAVNKTCPSGYDYNSSRGQCEKAFECAAGLTYNSSTQRCESTPTCASGTYQAATDNCAAPGDYAASVGGYTCPLSNGVGGTLSGATCSYNYGAATQSGCIGRSDISSYCYPYIDVNGNPSLYPGTIEPAGGMNGGYVCRVFDTFRAYNCTYGIHSYTYTCSVGSVSGSSCVGSGAATPTYTCPSGGTLSGTTCIKTNYTSAICPSGGVIDGTTDKCYTPPVCANGTWDSTISACKATATDVCPDGSTWDSASSSCIKDAACANGTLDVVKDQCWQAGGGEGICEGDLTYSCSDPTYMYNTGTSRCEKAPVCAAGTYNATYDKCILAINKTCPSGYDYNISRGQCEKAFECAAGLTYNSTTKRCEVTPTCASGTYQAATDNCAAPGNYAASVGGYTCPLSNGVSGTPSGATCSYNYGAATASGCAGLANGEDYVACIGVPVLGYEDGTRCLCSESNWRLAYYIYTCSVGSVSGSSCVGSGAATPTYTCPSGGTLSGTTCIKTNYTAATCPSGSTLDGATDKCYAPPVCPNGTWDSTISMCKATATDVCPDGSTWDSASSSCIKDAACANGTLDGTADVCWQAGTGNCPLGTTYNEGKCTAPATCASLTICTTSCSDTSYSYNAAVTRCEKSPVCAAGTYNATYDKCILAINKACPSGYDYNISRGQCEKAFECAAGLTYNSTTKRCEVTPACASGTYQAGTDNCAVSGNYAAVNGTIATVGIHSAAGNGSVSGYWVSEMDTQYFLGGSGGYYLAPYPTGAATVPIYQTPAGFGSPAAGALTIRSYGAAPVGYALPFSATCWYAYSICSGWACDTDGNCGCTYSPAPSSETYACYQGYNGYYFAYPAGQAPIPIVNNTGDGVHWAGVGDEGHPIPYYIRGLLGNGGSLWYNFLTTPTMSGLTCPSGGTLSGSTCIKTNYAAAICPSGGVIDETTDKCYTPPVCPNGTWDSTISMCKATATDVCPDGSTWDSASSSCIKDAACANGTLDMVKDLCWQVPAGCTTSSFNSGTNTCTSEAICPSGSTLNTTTGICVASGSTSQCDTGTWDIVSSKCIATPVTSCVAPYVKNTDETMCIEAPVCTSDIQGQPGTYSQGLNMCVAEAVHNCPNGMTWFGLLINKCESIPTCSLGEFNSGTNTCTAATCPVNGNNCFSLVGDVVGEDGKKPMYCTPNVCQSNTTGMLEPENPPTVGCNDVKDDGAKAPDGTCLGQIYIFNGKHMDCTKSDIRGLIGSAAKIIASLVLSIVGVGALLLAALSITAAVVGATTYAVLSAVATSIVTSAVNIAIDAATIGVSPGWAMSMATSAMTSAIGAYAQCLKGDMFGVPVYQTSNGNVIKTVTVPVGDASTGTLIKNGITSAPTFDFTQTTGGNSLLGNTQYFFQGQDMSTGAQMLQAGGVATTISYVRDMATNTLYKVTQETAQQLPGQAYLMAQKYAADVAPAMASGFFSSYSVKKCCYPDKMAASCTPAEREEWSLQAKGNCHVVGSFCDTKFLWMCMAYKESSCCFNSKLARILHEQGRPQLKAFVGQTVQKDFRGYYFTGVFGPIEAPVCRGFTPDEFQMLDFAQIDLSEYIQDIDKQVNAISGDVTKYMQSISNNGANRVNSLQPAGIE